MIQDQFKLTGKTAVVFGGRGFLGKRFCRDLQESGAAVISADRPEESHTAAKEGREVETPGVAQLQVDVTDPESVDGLAREIEAAFPRIDIMVYSVTAKPEDFYLPYTECSLEGWQKVLRAELDGLFLTTQRIGKVMEAQGKGSIILLSSIYGIVGNDQRLYLGSNLDSLYADRDGGEGKRVYSHASYAAAKGAAVNLTRYLACYWEGAEIRVNCVTPGGIAHPGENEEFVRKYSAKTPLGRKANVDEISGAVIYLASEASSYVTGHNLVVDGGWTAW